MAGQLRAKVGDLLALVDGWEAANVRVMAQV